MESAFSHNRTEELDNFSLVISLKAMEEERLYLIGLNMIPEITPRRMGILLARFPTPQAIWEASASELAAVPGFSEVANGIAAKRDTSAIDQELKLASNLGARIVTILDPDYPSVLREIDNPPVVLYMKGDGEIDPCRSIAIVGTRRASGYGKTVARSIASKLVALGIAVVSGLALGIDTAAHRGALDGNGSTVAVLGSGLGSVYPAENQRLAEEIVDSGGIVLSEYPVRMSPTKWTFPQRNRIISGISRGVVVVEAPEKSGALITARLAVEQGREVFAVPGPVTSFTSRGANHLLQDGAKLIMGVEDILSEFPDLAGLIQPNSEREDERLSSLTLVQQRVYDLIGLEPTHIDDIIAQGNISPTEAAHILLTLQLRNLIQEVEGRRYIRRP